MTRQFNDNIITASKMGNKEAVKNLLPFSNVNMVDANGCSALMWSAYNGHKEIVELLLEIPNINANLTDKSGATALMRASQKGHVEIVELLLKVPNINVNAKTPKGTTALILAGQKGYYEIVDLLNEVPNIDYNVRDYKGKTALEYSVNKMISKIIGDNEVEIDDDGAIIIKSAVKLLNLTILERSRD